MGFFVTTLILHLTICISVYRCFKKKIVDIPVSILILVLFIPVWGGVTALVSNHKLHILREKKAKNKADKTVGRTRKNIISDTDDKQEIIVPFEEAMIMNDSNQRRSLMVNILNRSPEKHVDLFLKVACAEDMETTHYAVTTMSELQKDYELKIQELQREYNKNDKDYNALKRYSNMLYDYISSGLIDSDILYIQRKRLSKLLKTQRKWRPDDIDLLFRSVSNELALENYKLASELMDYMLNKWSENGDVWIMKINLLSKMKRGNEIQNVLKQIEMNGIYFSNKGKEMLAFWNRRNEKGLSYEQEKRSVL